MKFQSFLKDEGKVVVYAFEITREEIERTPFTRADQTFFQNCHKGPVSRQILGISVLAKKIEDFQTLQNLKKEIKWTPSTPADPDESGRS